LTAIPFKNSTKNKKKQIKIMFNAIANRYDFLNHFFSLGIDIYWRKKVVQQAKHYKPKLILDLATGTADLAIALTRLKNTKIIALDIAEKMIRIAEKKIKQKKLDERINLVVGDGEALDFKENKFDLVTISLGIRNYENPNKGLKEIWRVLKNKGTIIVLEFSKPSNKILAILYNIYFTKILPFIGGLLSSKSAYNYLPDSVEKFPYGKDFKQILEKNQFTNVKINPLTFGIVTIYIATKNKFQRFD